MFVSCLFVWWISYASDGGDLATQKYSTNAENVGNWWESAEDVGINLNGSCLTGNWKWCMSYDILIRWKSSPLTEKNKNRTVMTIAQDVIVGATYMVWTVLTVILIYCWLMYIFASRWWKSPEAYKNWLVNAWIWAVLVRWAYAIVRLIQYIAIW